MNEAAALLASLGADPAALGGGPLVARSPIDGAEFGRLAVCDATATAAAIARAAAAFPPGATPRPPGAANWSACSVRNCAPPSPSSAGWSPWRAARSSRKGSAKCRR